jgi:hypothetical protein
MFRTRVPSRFPPLATTSVVPQGGTRGTDLLKLKVAEFVRITAKHHIIGDTQDLPIYRPLGRWLGCIALRLSEILPFRARREQLNDHVWCDFFLLGAVVKNTFSSTVKKRCSYLQSLLLTLVDQVISLEFFIYYTWKVYLPRVNTIFLTLDIEIFSMKYTFLIENLSLYEYYDPEICLYCHGIKRNFLRFT